MATGGFNFRTSTSLAGCGIVAGGGTWACTSARRLKQNFRPVDTEALLRRLARVPITTWNYRTQAARFRHIGPMAGDFQRAFAVGDSASTISMVDGAGVSLAAIQGLYRQNQALRRRVAGQDRRLAEQGASIAALERGVARLARQR